MKNLSIYMDPTTQAERDDDSEFQRKLKLMPIDFVDYALPRSEDRNHLRALEYLQHGRIDGKQVSTYMNWDRMIYYKIRKGLM